MAGLVVARQNDFFKLILGGWSELVQWLFYLARGIIARAFSVCAPVLWDDVPQSARDCLTVKVFHFHCLCLVLVSCLVLLDLA